MESKDRHGTRRRIVYVSSGLELTDEQMACAQEFGIVMRRPRPGAPRQRMYRVVLMSERDAKRLAWLKTRLNEILADKGLPPFDAVAQPHEKPDTGTA
jgi:hypothetical protein